MNLRLAIGLMLATPASAGDYVDAVSKAFDRAPAMMESWTGRQWSRASEIDQDGFGFWYMIEVEKASKAMRAELTQQNVQDCITREAKKIPSAPLKEMAAYCTIQDFNGSTSRP